MKPANQKIMVTASVARTAWRWQNWGRNLGKMVRYTRAMARVQIAEAMRKLTSLGDDWLGMELYHVATGREVSVSDYQRVLDCRGRGRNTIDVER